jgi:hypothetical protein
MYSNPGHQPRSTLRRGKVLLCRSLQSNRDQQTANLPRERDAVSSQQPAARRDAALGARHRLSLLASRRPTAARQPSQVQSARPRVYATRRLVFVFPALLDVRRAVSSSVLGRETGGNDKGSTETGTPLESVAQMDGARVAFFAAIFWPANRRRDVFSLEELARPCHSCKGKLEQVRVVVARALRPRWPAWRLISRISEGRDGFVALRRHPTQLSPSYAPRFLLPRVTLAFLAPLKRSRA